MAEQGTKTIAQNKKAFHDYFVLERYEAGIELFGTEVKSLRQGQVNLKDSFCKVYDGELLARGIPAERIRKFGFAFEGKQVLIG